MPIAIALLVDARDPEQFSGARRRGLRGGHIPGAINVPRELFFAPGGGFLPLDEIRRRVEEHGLSPSQRTVAYCNGGVAATVVLFNLARLGYLNLANYDGSWNEWGERLICRLSRDERRIVVKDDDCAGSGSANRTSRNAMRGETCKKRIDTE